MLGRTVHLDSGLSLRMALTADKPFLKTLHDDTRDDLWLIDGEEEFVRTIIDQQHKAQGNGYGNTFPDAYEFIIEKTGESIGRLLIDFGQNTVHVVDIALIRAARGHGYGTVILAAMQRVAAAMPAPVTLSVLQTNIAARAAYERLGFRVVDTYGAHHRMQWTPTASAMAG